MDSHVAIGVRVNTAHAPYPIEEDWLRLQHTLSVGRPFAVGRPTAIGKRVVHAQAMPINCKETTRECILALPNHIQLRHISYANTQVQTTQAVRVRYSLVADGSLRSMFSRIGALSLNGVI